MKILDLKTGDTVEVNDSYAARLIEQGKAVIPEKPKKAAKETKEK